MLATSTAALASTVTTRSSLSALSRIEHGLDRTIRTLERHLRRKLDTLEEHKLIIDRLDRELASWPGNNRIHHLEAVDLTQTIVTAERERMRAGSQASDSNYRPSSAYLTSQPSQKAFIDHHHHHPHSTIISTIISKPKEINQISSRHSISIATVFDPPTITPTTDIKLRASELLNALALNQSNTLLPNHHLTFHKRSNSCFNLHHPTLSRSTSFTHTRLDHDWYSINERTRNTLAQHRSHHPPEPDPSV
ncbi:hypothetical protein CROQUDRAFT_337349 [Cronartium quercuum f. sp. fusiforme G11]|uniref:Uncharacterized protein n=1 Tax=Cronartium quercuum f. sp. fusiforme G11 TaxID=708437 RepID=A0A9P6T6N4_9BASI|nr:hypothetical protein CROQUDRAFT_337349 [Cronartium quercuum f. sp. fusiforme G11]